MPIHVGRSANLRAQGPVIPLNIAVTRAAEQALQAGGQNVPGPVQVSALIDTGATISTIASGIAAQQLGLQPVGVVPVNTAGSTATPMPSYAVRLILNSQVWFETTAIEATHLAGQGIGALIGRDVLAHAVFIYQGGLNEFTLAL